MAAPTLTLLNSTSISTAESITGWTTFDTLDSDIKKEGSNGITGSFRADGANGNYSAGSAPVTAAGKTFRMWINTTNVAYMDTWANGGYELWVYDGSTSEYKTFMSSDDYYGGWFQVVYDMDAFTALTLANVEQWGLRCQHHTSAKNVDNVWVDALKYLDGYSMTGGTSGDEITLATIEEADRGTTTLYGYGIVTAYSGVYYATGEIQFGTGATTMWFLMDGEILIFEDKPIAAGLYKLSGVGAGSRVTIKNSLIRATGTTDATRFDMDWSDTNLLSLTFTDNLIVRADTIDFKSGQTATGNIFNDCGQITPAGADMTGSEVAGYEGTADTSALIWNVATDPDGYLDDMAFTMGTALTHAIEFGLTSPLTINLNDIAFSGYTNTIGSSAAPIHVKRTSGTVTINASGCTGITADGYKTAGATVVIVLDEVPLTVTALDLDDQSAIEDALVTLYKSTGAAITSITRTGDVATVTQTAHGYETGDWVAIKGCTRPTYAAYNGVHQITWLSSTTYSFPVFGSPATPALGTKTAHLCYIHELTNASGVATETLAYSADITVEGRVTKGTRDPRYKPAPLSGTITTAGFTQTAFMISD